MGATAKRMVGRWFYFAMAALLTAIVAYGFGGTIEVNLFHGSFPRPKVLYVHAAVFAGWMLVLTAQTGLVAIGRKTAWHRRLGWLGLVMGAAMPVLGIWTALAMTRLRAGFGDEDAVAFMVLAFNDMIAFALLFGLAMLWRDRPETHKRLVFLAACAICVAALTRFPPWLPTAPEGVWSYYAWADGLMLLGVLRDLVVNGRPHPVYGRALPALVAAQAAGNALYMTRAPAWMALAHRLI